MPEQPKLTPEETNALLKWLQAFPLGMPSLRAILHMAVTAYLSYQVMSNPPEVQRTNPPANVVQPATSAITPVEHPDSLPVNASPQPTLATPVTPREAAAEPSEPLDAGVLANTKDRTVDVHCIATNFGDDGKFRSWASDNRQTFPLDLKIIQHFSTDEFPEGWRNQQHAPKSPLVTFSGDDGRLHYLIGWSGPEYLIQEFNRFCPSRAVDGKSVERSNSTVAFPNIGKLHDKIQEFQASIDDAKRSQNFAIATPASQKINGTIWGPVNCQPCNQAVIEGNRSTKFKFTKRSDIEPWIQTVASQVGSYPIVSFVGPKGDVAMQWPGSAESFEAEYTRVWRAGGAGPVRPVYLKDCK